MPVARGWIPVLLTCDPLVRKSVRLKGMVGLGASLIKKGDKGACVFLYVD